MINPVCVDTVLKHAGAAPGGDDLVSIAVSLHNYGRFLPECLESVAAQLHGPLELIVVDDASAKDDSLAVAQAWMAANSQRFVRTLLLRHRRNQGLAQTRNTAFAAAHAAYVFVLDADNALYPRAIGRMHSVARREAAAAAYCQLEFFGNQSCLGHADVWDSRRLQRGNYIDAMALVNKRAWHDAGGYTHLEGGWDDYDFWCKFAGQGLSALYIPETLCRYRVHDGSMLRTEHAAHSERLAVQMSLRHPWLRLG